MDVLTITHPGALHLPDYDGVFVERSDGSFASYRRAVQDPSIRQPTFWAGVDLTITHYDLPNVVGPFRFDAALTLPTWSRREVGRHATHFGDYRLAREHAMEWLGKALPLLDRALEAVRAVASHPPLAFRVSPLERYFCCDVCGVGVLGKGPPRSADQRCGRCAAAGPALVWPM